MIVKEALDISVIICAYTEERWDGLVAAVESIKGQMMAPREIIVVIDHNARLLARVRGGIEGVTVIENERARGLSGARNSGIARAQGNLIAFLDDDAVAAPDWLVELSQCFTGAGVLGVGGSVVPCWEDSQPGWFPEQFYWVVGCSYRGLPRERAVVRNAYGGCACYRREVFEGVGGFRDGIGRAGGQPMGGEETELCIRARQRWPQGYFLYEPRAKIQHRIPCSRGRWGYFCARCYAEGLSKAQVTRYVGTKDGLASERRYMLRTLPGGVVREVISGICHGNMRGFLRAGAIIVGVLMTTAGFVVGCLYGRDRAIVHHILRWTTINLGRHPGNGTQCTSAMTSSSVSKMCLRLTVQRGEDERQN